MGRLGSQKVVGWGEAKRWLKDRSLVDAGAAEPRTQGRQGNEACFSRLEGRLE